MSKKIVICGGGVIGCSVAYHLSQLGVGSDVRLVEPVDIACAASGKAGGFLARDWCDESPVSELARKSFQLHSDLAMSLGEDCGYRRVDTLSVTFGESLTGRSTKEDSDCPEWVTGNVFDSSEIGNTDTTAQVHPRLFSRALFRHAQNAGVQLVKDGVVGLQTVPDGSGKAVRGLTLSSGKELEADVVVIAMGPWSCQAQKWLPELPLVSGRKAHSITMRPKAEISAHALFLEYRTELFQGDTEEIYPRPDGEVYVCGATEPKACLPDDPASVKPTDGSCEKLKLIAGKLSLALEASDIECRQACFLPTSPDGLPIIGAVPGTKGAYVATGHSCWGILNSPATGKGLAELIVHGSSSSVDLTSFDPKRFLANQ